jgi:hypothetical protein
MKFAIVVPCAKNYITGLNAMVNAADYYGFEAEFHVLTRDGPDEWFADKPHCIRHDLNGLVREVGDARPSHVWQLKFLRWVLAGQLNHDAIAVLDADCLLLSDWTRWFSLVTGKEHILTAHNVLGSDAFDGNSEPHHTNSVPVTNLPWICDPRQHHSVFAEILRIGLIYNMGDMPAQYFALRNMGKLDKVILLNDATWLFNNWYIAGKIKNITLDGKKYIYNQREKMHMAHKKWWLPNHIETCCRGLNDVAVETTRHNGVLLKNTYQYFNTECRWPIATQI